MDEKPEWLKRAEHEQKMLAYNIKKLTAMLADGQRMELIEAEDMILMHDQLAAMTVYNSKLTMRIQAHGGVTCAEWL